MSKQTPNLAALLREPFGKLVVEERPIPTPGEGEVLVRNHAVAINPIDWKRQTWNVVIHSFPTVLGTDLSGVVEAVGPGVTAFKPGDRVQGAAPGFKTGNPDHGTFQTYTVTQTSLLGRLPDSASFDEGAAMVTALGTASMALFVQLGVPRPPSQSTGSSILVWGGSAVIGVATIQLARLAGLTVYTTGSPKHHAFLRKIGASTVVDYRSPTAAADIVDAAAKAGDKISLAFDAIGSAETLPSVAEILTKSSGDDAATKKKKIAHSVEWPKDLPVLDDSFETDHVHGEYTFDRNIDLPVWFYAQLPAWLESGVLVPSPQRVIPGGVAAFQEGLDILKAGVSLEKLIVNP